MRLSRAVTTDDIRVFHKACPHCLRQVLIKINGQYQFCPRALKDFANGAAGRYAQGPGGDTHWIAGADPDQWALTNIFLGELLDHAFWHDWTIDAKRWFAGQARIRKAQQVAKTQEGAPCV